MSGGPWRGRTTQASGDKGDRRLLDIENGYVSSDGSEVRSWPGFKCCVDPISSGLISDAVDSRSGYRALAIDARLGVVATSGSYQIDSAGATTQYVWAEPYHLHGFKFVRDRLILFGETTHRREPILTSGGGSYVELRGWNRDGSNRAVLILNTTAATTLNTPNNIVAGQVIYIENLTSSFANPADITTLNNNFHYVVSVTPANNITLATTVLAAEGGSNLAKIGEIGRTLGNSTGVYPIDFWEAGSDRHHEKMSLTSYQLEALPNTTTPVTTVYPAHVANRQRDFADDAATTDIEGYQNSTLTGLTPAAAYGMPRRMQKALTGRLVPDVAADRLLLACSGYGCVFQVPVVVPVANSYAEAGAPGVDYAYNDIFDRPRCIGLPKAVLVTSIGNDGAAPSSTEDASLSQIGGSGLAAGSYLLQIAFKDDATGEVGLASEVQEVTVPGSGNWVINFLFVHPGYYMSECLGLSINVYMSDTNGNVLGLVHTTSAYSTTAGDESFKYGLDAAADPSDTELVGFFQLPSAVLADLASNIDFDQSPPSLKQMPMGSKVCKTIRGVTIYGGYAGTHGQRRELQFLEARYDYDVTGSTNHPYADQIHFQVATVALARNDTHDMVAVPIIPPAYAGQRIYSESMFPYPQKIHQLDKMVNCVADTAGSPPDLTEPFKWYQRWRLRQRPTIDGLDWTPGGNHNAFILLPQGTYQVSEAGFPSYTPANQTGFLDSHDQDIEALGAYGGIFFLFTKEQTFALQWQRSPKGNTPYPVSRRFGAICPVTAEFDGGCAFISERGPAVATPGGIEHIGRDLEKEWVGDGSIYLRDSEGLMRHSWVAHDPDRQLLLFGVFTNRNSTTILEEDGTTTFAAADDDMKSRFPCDTVLVYSYQSGAWSTWVPPSGLEVLWMEHGRDSDAQSRMFFLAADWRIYALDDDYCDTNKEGVQLTATTGETGTTLSSFTGTAFNGANGFGSDDQYIRAGMHVVLAKADGTYVAQTTVSSVTVGTQDVVFADSLTWLTGYIFHIGVRPPMKIQGNFMAPKGVQPSDIDGIGVRYQLQSRIAAGISDATISPQELKAWATMDVIAMRDRDDRVEVSYDAGSYQYLGKTASATGLTPHAIRFELGRVTLPEVSLRLQVIGEAQVRIPEIIMEIA